jgi:hypothetical protein
MKIPTVTSKDGVPRTFRLIAATIRSSAKGMPGRLAKASVRRTIPLRPSREKPAFRIPLVAKAPPD